MKGYDILTQWRALTPEQRDNWMQYFLGKVSSDFEGFRDSEERPEFPYAKYLVENATESFEYISMKRPDLHRVTRTVCRASKCGVNVDLEPDGFCSDKCRHEADHPPIEALGHDNLSAEELQKLHQQVSGMPLVATGDSIENGAFNPPEKTLWQSGPDGVPYDGGDGGPIPSQAVIDAFLAAQEDKQPWHTACYDCRNVVYPLDSDRRRPSSQMGVKSPDGHIRCKLCNDKHIQPTKLLEGTPCSMPAQIMIDGLKVSTDTLAFHLIPYIAIKRLCERIMLGEETKGKDAWNALSENQHVLDSKKALARRFGHTINHAYKLLGKIQRGESWTEEDEREASAVMWGGMYAICAIHQQRTKQCPKNET